jgi:hypothetical protein
VSVGDKSRFEGRWEIPAEEVIQPFRLSSILPFFFGIR